MQQDNVEDHGVLPAEADDGGGGGGRGRDGAEFTGEGIGGIAGLGGLGAIGAEGGPTASILEEENLRVISKLTKNIIPLIWSISFFSFLLRVCLVNMHVVLTKELNLSEYQYGGALGAFYLGFVVFPVPANLILERMRMSAWISLLVCVWGCITLLSVFTSDATSLIAFRFCLGVAESGLYPGVVYYITTWFGERHRVRQLSLIQTAIPCAYATGGFLSSVILEHMDGKLGMCGWRWIYILTGVPTLFLSIVFYYCLPNSPSEARFLTARDREVLVYSRAMAASVWANQHKTSRSLFMSTVLNSRNWMFAFCGMFAMATMTGVSGFLPAILYEAGSSFIMSNRLIVIPAGLSLCALLCWAFHSSRIHNRFWHAFGALFLALVALGACTVFVFFIDLSLVVVLLCIYQSAMYTGYSIFIAEMVNSVLGSTSIGIGLYYAVAGFGGWCGPYVMGYMRDLTGDNVVGLAVLSASLAICIALFATIHVTQRNTQIEIGKQMKGSLHFDASQSEGIKYEPKGEDEGGAAILV